MQETNLANEAEDRYAKLLWTLAKDRLQYAKLLSTLAQINPHTLHPRPNEVINIDKVNKTAKMATRPTVTIASADGTPSGSTHPLPAVFKAPIRPDIVQ